MPDESSPSFHLAQYNVARMVYPLDAPEMTGFRELLDPIHKAGDESPGFVWRFKGAEGDYALDVRPSDGDAGVLVSMTVWETPEALQAFMRGAHFEAFRRRREWFAKGSGENVCWWVPVGHQPTLQEGEAALARLRHCGESSLTAFTLRDIIKARTTNE